MSKVIFYATNTSSVIASLYTYSWFYNLRYKKCSHHYLILHVRFDRYGNFLAGTQLFLQGFLLDRIVYYKNTMVNSSVIEYTTNEALFDPFENQRYVYFILAIIMGVSIALNVAAIILLAKDKYLRKRSQYLVFSIISVSEIFNDVLYLMLLFLRQYGDYMCMLIFLVYLVNRHNVFIHLLYVCVERYCALSMSSRSLFTKLTTVKTRLVFLCCSFTATSALFLPMFLLYSKKSTKGCGVMNLFGPNATIMLNLIRIIFSMEAITISVLYFYISKKIRMLVSSQNPTNSTISSTNPCTERTQTSRLQNDQSAQGPSGKRLISTNKVKANTLAEYTNYDEPTAKTERQTTDSREARQDGDKWKLKAFYILRTHVVVTVILSLPMIVFQILSFIEPSTYTDPKVNIALSTSNMLHAILFPFMFIVQLKKRQTTN